MWQSLNQLPLSKISLSSAERHRSFTHPFDGGGVSEGDGNLIEIGDGIDRSDLVGDWLRVGRLGR